LPTVYGLVNEAGGHIEITSALGEGTSVAVFLTLSDKQPVTADLERPSAWPAGRVLSGRVLSGRALSRRALSRRALSRRALSRRALSRRALSRRALLVEDQDELRTLEAQALDEAGLQVSVAASAEGALEVAAQGEAPFDILVSDVMLPGMPGPDLAEVLGAGQA
jgi:two-component system cell cycle sensor histidine kinase/response regulator CckA